MTAYVMFFMGFQEAGDQTKWGPIPSVTAIWGAFAGTRDPLHHPVDFKVATPTPSMEFNASVKKKSVTHEDVKTSSPTVPTNVSLMVQNIRTTLAYSGWVMNSAKIWIQSLVRWA